MRISVGLKVILAAVAMVTVWFGLIPTLLGENGLGLGHGMVPFMPPQTAVTVPVVPDRGFAARAQEKPNVAQVFPWAETSDGTKDAHTGLPPVELGAWNMDLALLGPSFTDRLLYAAPQLMLQAMILLVVYLLWRMVASLAGGEVFTRVNARRMLAIGVLVGVGGMFLQVVGNWAWAEVIAHSAAAGIVRAHQTFSLLPLVVGAVILLLAEVFRQGVKLRAEVDGLV